MNVFRNRTAASALAGVGIAAGLCLALFSASSAQAAPVNAGPILLGTAGTYGVLAGSGITSTGPTVVNGDIGVFPTNSITGFTPAEGGTVNGTIQAATPQASIAKDDLTTAYNTAAGLSPTTTGLADLTGMSLVPGVYSGGALSIADNGTLTLNGTAASNVWVFQAASTLTINSGAQINFTGPVSACNVFWQVGSSATIISTHEFEGTILAHDSISLSPNATVAGRLLARGAQVSLLSNTITVPSNCPATSGNGAASHSPVITSGRPSTAHVGMPYHFDVTASGTPSPTFRVSSGSLPTGLGLNPTTGAITGTPTSLGTATFAVTVSNGVGTAATATYALTTAAVLAETGVDPEFPILLASALFFAGLALTLVRIRSRRLHG